VPTFHAVAVLSLGCGGHLYIQSALGRAVVWPAERCQGREPVVIDERGRAVQVAVAGQARADELDGRAPGDAGYPLDVVGAVQGVDGLTSGPRYAALSVRQA